MRGLHGQPAGSEQANCRMSQGGQILCICNARFLSQWYTLPDTPVHCGIEMLTCTLTVQFTLKQNALKLLILGQF